MQDDQSLNTKQSCVAVTAALEKLEQTQSPHSMTLEEIMMCSYHKPCRRILPGSDPVFRKYGRGSTLVYKNEVVLVLLPDDDTVYFPARGVRCIGPKVKRYKGVLPRSSFYTNGGVYNLVLTPFEEVVAWREVFHNLEPTFGPHVSCGGMFGVAAHQRCKETFILMGRLAAKRLLRQLPPAQKVPQSALEMPFKHGAD